jgi:hypothetical protein
VGRQLIKMVIFQGGHLFTPAANQVMVRGITHNFKNSMPADVGFGHQLKFAEKIQNAVNGGPVNRWLLFINRFINLAGGGVPAVGTDDIKDNLSLRGHAVATFTDMLHVINCVVGHGLSSGRATLNAKIRISNN